MKLTDAERTALVERIGYSPYAVRAACHAPFLTMSFHPTGKVLACCRKPSQVLGDIRLQRLDDIWNSAARRELMRTMARFEFPEACGVCATYVASGDLATADAVRTYGSEGTYSPDPIWPTRLEFNLSNACPLQCVACSGEYSSAIRALRERLPPLPHVYGDEFFADLRKYLERLDCGVFLGGEPFIQWECDRVWSMLVELGSRAHCYVNTNGMVFDERVAELLSKLRMTIAISFDGARAETVERARLGASFATLLRNARSFRPLVAASGGELVFNFCPMRSNWQEFPEFLSLADGHGARAYVNTMVAPEDLSLYFLPRKELRAVLDTLDAGVAARPGLSATQLATWAEFRTMLENKLERTDLEGLQQALARGESVWKGRPERSPTAPERDAVALVERGRRVLADPSYSGILAQQHERGVYPFYAERADGARVWDASGREYLDWYMGGGPMVLGHRHPAVQAAVREQLERGANLTMPAALEVEVAERLCALFPSAQSVLFGKNGTDVTSAAVKLARIATGRDMVLKSGYHGFQDWSWAADPDAPGIPQALRDLVREIPYNDLDAARELVRQHGARLAAIVVEPLRYADASPEFLCGLRELADGCGALLVFDEVVTGLRVGRGGLQGELGLRPDLTCLSKALANGLPLSALIGARRWMRHVLHSRFGLTFRLEALSLAAARATLDVHRDTDVAGHLVRIGEHLRQGFAQSCARLGVPGGLLGHPAMLHLSFGAHGRLERRGAEELFQQVCQRHGLFVRLHRLLPSLAHTDDDVERTLDVFDRALRSVRQAMDHGLEGRLHGPIWEALEKPGAPPEAQAPSVKAAPNPFVHLPADARASTLVLSCRADRSDSFVTHEGDAILFHLGPAGPGGRPTSSVDLPVDVSGPCRARARYVFDAPPRSNANLSIQWIARDRKGVETVVQHDLSFGEFAWTRASQGAQRRESACAYGLTTAELILDVDARHIRPRHIGEWTEDLAPFPRPHAGSLRFQFRVTGTLDGPPIELRLIDLAIEPASSTPRP